MINKNEISTDLMELLEGTPVLSESSKELRGSPVDFDNDPDFVADYLKAVLINDIITAMKENNINKNELAKKIGCSKQYIGRILNETTNYTIETIAKIACALGKEITLKLKDKDARSVVQNERVVDENLEEPTILFDPNYARNREKKLKPYNLFQQTYT